MKTGKKLAYEVLVQKLQEAGVRKGDVVHVQSDLMRVGPVDAPQTREGIFSFYLSAFREALGEEGTISCCTSFEDYARYGSPFILESSPSLTDAFSEHIRTRPGSVRSLHPVVSVTGLGARAAEICGGNHFAGFGYDSPWGRLHRADALIVTLGLDCDPPQIGNIYPSVGVTFLHYVESVYTVPYQYTKIYDFPVIANGNAVDAVFSLSVRYLDFNILNSGVRMKKDTVKRNIASLVPIGRSSTWSCRAKSMADFIMERLAGDRYYLLESPPSFRNGEIPFDGRTGKMQIRYGASANGQ